MVSSLTVLKIDTIIKKDAFDKKELSLEAQTTLEPQGIEQYGLGLPKTNITNHFLEAGFIKYTVKMSTDTVKKPIYIFEDGYKEWLQGYQPIEYFEFWIDENFSFLYIFASKTIAEAFKQRLEKERYANLSDMQFDFSKLGELTNLDSAWGTWENSEGIIRRVAKFGKGIDSIIENYEPITTFYIDYKYSGKLIQLILSVEGRISTQSNLKHKDILHIYNDVSRTLFKT